MTVPPATVPPCDRPAGRPARRAIGPAGARRPPGPAPRASARPVTGLPATVRPATGRRGDRPAGDAGRACGRGAPPRPAEPPRPKARRLQPGRAYRDAVLAELSPERKAVAEQILRGGIPAVRQAVEEQNAKAREVGGPEIKADALLAVAEELLPALRAAEWRDRAEAAVAIVDEISVRDLRAVVSGADTARDEEGRALAAQLREALDRRAAAERQTWVDEITSSLDDGRVVRALRISGRPPEPGCPVPGRPGQAPERRRRRGPAPDTTPDRWAAVLEAVVASPVRRTITPRGLPAEPGEALTKALRLAAAPGARPSPPSWATPPARRPAARRARPAPRPGGPPAAPAAPAARRRPAGPPAAPAAAAPAVRDGRPPDPRPAVRHRRPPPRDRQPRPRPPAAEPLTGARRRRRPRPASRPTATPPRRPAGPTPASADDPSVPSGRTTLPPPDPSAASRPDERRRQASAAALRRPPTAAARRVRCARVRRRPPGPSQPSAELPARPRSDHRPAADGRPAVEPPAIPPRSTARLDRRRPAPRRAGPAQAMVGHDPVLVEELQQAVDQVAGGPPRRGAPTPPRPRRRRPWARPRPGPTSTVTEKSRMTKWWSSPMRSTQPTIRSQTPSTPVSSSSSRTTASASVSPASTRPPGIDHSPAAGPWPRRTSSSRPSSTAMAPTHTSGLTPAPRRSVGVAPGGWRPRWRRPPAAPAATCAPRACGR